MSFLLKNNILTLKSIITFLPVICVLLLILTASLLGYADSTFYPSNYFESRANFIKLGEKVKKIFPEAQQLKISIPTKTKAHLTTDLLFIPQSGQNQERLFVLSSGVHGVEAFTGSAISFGFMESFLKPEIIAKTGVLIIHAVNPYGYQFKRRVTENNVDLNRNFVNKLDTFGKENKAYSQLSNFLNPSYPLKMDWITTTSLFLRSIANLFIYGRKQLTQAALSGQYQQKKGIYFGGFRQEPNTLQLKEKLLEISRAYKKIFHIDLHTGYGRKSELHFFSNPQVAKSSPFQKIFSEYSIDLASDQDFYEVSGSFDQFFVQAYPQKQVIATTFEFGTMDSQTTLGGFYSLKNMIQENQGFHYGYQDQNSEEQSKKNFLEMFNPSDKIWRQKVLEKSHKTFSTILPRFYKI